ncbi:hypothetical protein HDU91_001663, partial [Kappamyces sp. JEL0680]
MFFDSLCDAQFSFVGCGVSKGKFMDAALVFFYLHAMDGLLTLIYPLHRMLVSWQLSKPLWKSWNLSCTICILQLVYHTMRSLTFYLPRKTASATSVQEMETSMLLTTSFLAVCSSTAVFGHSLNIHWIVQGYSVSENKTAVSAMYNILFVLSNV